MKIQLAKIIYFIKEKHIFLFDEFRNYLLRMPLKFLEIKIQKIQIYKLLYLIEKNDDLKDDFSLKNRIKSYIENQDFLSMETQEENMTCFINSVKILNDDEIVFSRSGDDRREITIFYITYLFP